MNAFLFPGQGAQFPEMGVDLYRADASNEAGIASLFDLASAILNRDIVELLSSDPETLKRTDVSQPAITVASLAAAKALIAKGIAPDVCAGFSLGEYPALAVAGVISEEDAIRLTVLRGKAMQSACDALGSSAGMLAVLGLSADKVEEVARESGIADLYCANYNSPRQTVVSGTAAALEAAESVFAAAGARRTVALKVAGPFHCPLMSAAADEFSEILEKVVFSDPKIPIFSNVTGSRLASGAEAKKCAVIHITNPVRWTAEEAGIEALSRSAESELALFETGPGKTLSGLWSQSGCVGTCKPYADAL